ncbi:hypothetical protein FRB99_006429 [Tulasnella sp. 403]|nr:hypothetical protein FRB99_006429 [Tulasnella sp. 403]
MAKDSNSIVAPVANGKMNGHVNGARSHSVLAGHFKAHFDTDIHAKRSLLQLRSKSDPLEKYVYLNGLKERDPRLFYSLLVQNLPEFTPLVYTPTIGAACQNYSHIYRHPEGLVVSLTDKGRIKDVLRSWPNVKDARIAVVTDGSRILGLGDLGVNGLPISLGKLDLYIAGAGIRPESTVPICLDLGTNTEAYLNDPLYLGLRQRRVPPNVMQEFMQEFMDAMKEVFPKLLVQFEDFSTDNAFYYLNQFQNTYRCFNDDIQGTGSVILAGFHNAAHVASSHSSSTPALRDHKILFYGAGSAGIGVAKQLMSFFLNLGMSEEEAKSHIWTVDSKGLIYEGRQGVAAHKTYFARKDYTGPPIKSLKEIIEYVRPTALLGLSTQKDAFTEEIVTLMSTLNPRPIIFPLSNPSSLCELEYADAVRWSKGQVLFASGSPYLPVEWEGNKYEPGQGNNMYVFPGIGLGSILCSATRVTDKMVERAAMSLANSLTDTERAEGLIYPRLTRIREVSADIAVGVIRQAQEEGVDERVQLRDLNDASLLQYVKEKMWDPSADVGSKIKSKY